MGSQETTDSDLKAENDSFGTGWLAPDTEVDRESGTHRIFPMLSGACAVPALPPWEAALRVGLSGPSGQEKMQEDTYKGTTSRVRRFRH